jgi:hypothetical protein
MKKYLFSAGLILACSFMVAAQEVETNDGSKISIDGVSYNFIFSWKKDKHHKIKPHNSSWSFTFSNLGNIGDAAEPNYGRSYSWMLDIGGAYHTFNNHWLVSINGGLDWTRYHFNGNVRLWENNGRGEFTPDPNGRNYRDSKVLIYYLKIPLLLEYQTGRYKEGFFINGGVEGLVKLYSKSQVEAYQSDNSISKEDLRGLNLYPINVRAVLRIGIAKTSLFGYYQPISLFNNNKGPELYPFGVGVSLGF